MARCAPGGVDEGDGHPRHGPRRGRGPLDGDSRIVGAARVAQRPVGPGHELRRRPDHGCERIGDAGRGAHLHSVDEAAGVGEVLAGGEHEDHGLLGVEDAPPVLRQHPEDLRLGQRRVDGQRRLHETTELSGVAGGGLFGLAALVPQQDALDGDGDPLGQPRRRLDVGEAVAAPADAGHEAERPEREPPQVDRHHHHGLDVGVGVHLRVAAGDGGLAPVGRAEAPGADDDFGAATGQHPPDEHLAFRVGVAGVGARPSPVGAVGDAPQRALFVHDVDGEPVGEGGHDHVDEAHHGLVVGLEGGGEHVAGARQDGHVLPGVLGAEAAAALGLVETGPLDRGGGAVGHQLQQLQVAFLEAVPDAGTDLHHPDDLPAHQQRGRHQRRHPLAQQRCGLGRLGHVVEDHGLGARRHLAHDALAHEDLEAVGDPGVEAVRGPHREAGAVGGDEEDGGHVPPDDLPGPGQQLVEQHVQGQEGQARVGDRLDGAQRHPGVVQAEPDAALGHAPEHEDDRHHDRAGEDEQPRQGAVDGEEVEDDDREQRPGDDEGGLAQEGVAAQGLAQEAVGLGPVVLGDDGGGVGLGRVPVGGADVLLTPSEQAVQAPHAP